MALIRESSPTLLTLPKEVRLRIYEYVFLDSEVFLDRQSRHGKPWSLRYDQEVCMFRRDDLNVLMSCRTIWREAVQSIQTARLKQCRGATETSRIDYRLCYLLLSEAQGLHIKHLVTSCPRAGCVKSIIHYQLTPYLESIEWHTPMRFSPPSINDCLPTGATILRSVLLETVKWDDYSLPVWRERIYDVRTNANSRPMRIIIKPC